MDDNPADIDLMADILTRNACPSHIHAVVDGMEAMGFVRRRGKYRNAVRPDLVLLDLKLPGKDGRAVLGEMKSDPDLRNIPIVIFSTSKAPEDVQRSYELGANCYISKPGNLREFVSTVTAIADYWFCCSLLPEREN